MTAVYSPHEYLQETMISSKAFFDIHFNCMQATLSRAEQVFVDSINFTFHKCGMKNKEVYHYLLLNEILNCYIVVNISLSKY